MKLLTSKKFLDKKFLFIFCCLFFFLGFFIYENSLNNLATNWDDRELVIENPFVHNLTFRNIKYIFLIKKGIILPLSEYIPITLLSFAVENEAIGNEPIIYHATNLLLHISNGILVLFFIYFLTRNKWLAFWVSLFFIVHPLQVEPVCWISGRKDVLYSFFYLSGLCVYLLTRRNSKLIYKFFLFLIFLCSLLSKPSAVSFPIVLLLCDYYYERRFRIKHLFSKLQYFVAAFILGVITIVGQHANTTLSQMTLNEFIENCIFACRGFVFYISKVFMPTHLSPVYPRPEILEFHLIIYITSIILCIIYLLALFLLRNKKIIFFGMAFFLITLMPVLQILPVGVRVIAADRFFYLPSIGFFLFIVASILHLINKYKLSKHIFIVLALLIVILWSILAHKQTLVWKNSCNLWKRVIVEYPKFGLAYNSLGSFYFENQEYDRGRNYVNKSIEISGPDPHAYHNLGVYELNHGSITQALYYANKIIEEFPGLKEGYLLMGFYNSRITNYSKCIYNFVEALNLDPRDVILRETLAACCLKSGKTNAAMQQLRVIAYFEPKHLKAYFLLGSLNESLKKYSIAEKYYQQSITLQSDLPILYYRIALVQQMQNKYKKSIRNYLSFINLVPNHANSLANIAICYKRMGKMTEALTYIEKGLNASPNSPKIFYNYACIAAVSGKTNTALQKLESAIDLQPALRFNAKGDKDFILVRENPEFKRITNQTD